MNNIRLLICTVAIIVCISSCGKEEENVSLMDHIENISESTYYDQDPFTEEDSTIYGVWEAISRSQSGIAGTVTLEKDFDYLIIKPNGIFGIVTDDTLLTTGKIEIADSENLRIQFIPEASDLNISILQINTASITAFVGTDDDKLDLHYGQSATHLQRVVE